MGIFLNEGNLKFAEFSKTKYFVDKTEMLNVLLEKDADEKFICCSRPRRFGKSVTADMVAAYFSRGVDSKSLFEPLKCIKNEMFIKNMNLNVAGCRNDMHTFTDKDQVITTLIHLGYFAYDKIEQEAYVPNKEIQEVFYKYMKNQSGDNLSKFMRLSESIAEAVLTMDEDATARLIQAVHSDFISSIEYNDENSLSCTIMVALLAFFRYYHKPVREFPCGKGVADIVYLPLAKHPNRPVVVVELKWNKDAQTAITQIKERAYPEPLKDYSGEVLLVGITYDKKTKEHQCMIESYQKEEDNSPSI